MLSLLRTFVYCWLAAALLGCSLPHPLPIDPPGFGETVCYPYYGCLIVGWW